MENKILGEIKMICGGSKPKAQLVEEINKIPKLYELSGKIEIMK